MKAAGNHLQKLLMHRKDDERLSCSSFMVFASSSFSSAAAMRFVKDIARVDSRRPVFLRYKAEVSRSTIQRSRVRRFSG